MGLLLYNKYLPLPLMFYFAQNYSPTLHYYIKITEKKNYASAKVSHSFIERTVTAIVRTESHQHSTLSTNSLGEVV